MSIFANCPICGKRLEAPESFGGKTGACPNCKAPVTFPRAVQPTVVPQQLPAKVVPQKKIELRCPRCDNTSVKALSIVWGQGSSSSTGTSVGLGGLAGGSWSALAAGLSQSHNTRSSTLAKQCEPPKEKPVELAQGAMGCGWLLLIGGILGFIGAVVQQNSRDAADAVGGLFVALIVGPILIVAGRQSLKAIQQYNRNEYPKLHQEWQNGFLCLQCGNRFEL